MRNRCTGFSKKPIILEGIYILLTIVTNKQVQLRMKKLQKKLRNVHGNTLKFKRDFQKCSKLILKLILETQLCKLDSKFARSK